MIRSKTGLKTNKPLKAKTGLKTKKPLQAKTGLKANKGLSRGTKQLKTNKPLTAKTPLKQAGNGLKTDPQKQLKRTPMKRTYKQDPERTSIVYPDLTRCCFCGKVHDPARGVWINKHEIFFGKGNRTKSIEDKMIAPICSEEHNMGTKCVHNNREMDLFLKHKAQRIWEQTYGTREDFIKRYGKSWLDERPELEEKSKEKP